MWLVALLMALTPAVAAPKSVGYGYTSMSYGYTWWRRPTRLQLFQYRQHVASTRGLDRLTAKRNPTFRYDFGMVNIKALNTGSPIGYVAVRKGNSGEVREDWFFADPNYYDDPGAEFTMQMAQPGSLNRAGILSYLYAEAGAYGSYGWHTSTYEVKEVPSTSAVAGLGITNPMIEAYTFELKQGGVTVGSLHREAHLNVQGNPTKMVDHYVVYSGKVSGVPFSTLLKAGETVEVHTAGTQYTTTSGFFAGEGSKGPENYSKVEYKVGYTALYFAFTSPP